MSATIAIHLCGHTAAHLLGRTVIDAARNVWTHLIFFARRRTRLARHAVAEVDDARAERAGLDEFEIHPALALGKERDATANQHRVDHGPVLVDQTQRGRLGGERGAADGDVPLPRLGSQPLDLLHQAAGGEAGIALHRRQRGGEHHLWERIPEGGPLELCVVERWNLIGGLPVQHRLVQPASQQVDADPSYLVDPEAKDLLVGGRPVEAAVRPDDVAVKRDAHRIGHAAHQEPWLLATKVAILPKVLSSTLWNDRPRMS